MACHLLFASLDKLSSIVRKEGMRVWGGEFGFYRRILVLVLLYFIGPELTALSFPWHRKKVDFRIQIKADDVVYSGRLNEGSCRG